MYPTCSMVLRTTADISIQAEVVISPATSTKPVVVAVSHATRAMGSCAKIASSTPSEIWSQSLSGCPSVTDSLVKNAFGIFIKSLNESFSFFLLKVYQAGGGKPNSTQKSPCISGAFAFLLIPLILRNNPPELAPFLQCCKRVVGLHRAVSLHLS